MRGAETIVRQRPKRPGRFGDEDGPPDLQSIPGCFMIPRGSSETNVRETTVVTGMLLIAPPGADIKATDRIVYLDLTYQVEGDVGRYRKGGREVAVQAALKRVTG